MKFPTMVYKSPGKHNAGHYRTYDFKGVKDQKEFDKALKEGWSETLPEALEKKPKKSNKREELENLADKLDIKYDGRTSDKKLEDNIDAAINEREEAEG